MLLAICMANAVAEDLQTIQSDAATQAIQQYDIALKQLTESYEQRLTALDRAYTARLISLRHKLKADLDEARRQIAADDLDDAVRIRDFSRAIDTLPVTPPNRNADALEKSPDTSMDGLKKKLADTERETSTLRSELEAFKHFQPVIVIEQQPTGSEKDIIVLQPNGKILTNEPNIQGSWSLKGRALTLTWKTNRGVVIDSNVLDEKLLTFSGMNNAGRKLTGRVLLGGFVTP